MEFFNQKEEVLDVQLTEYGKYLLSIGQLRPEYYAFFDDDILYDVSGSGFTEDQNNANPRILNNTPRLKVAATRTGAETRVDSFLDRVVPALNGSDPAHNVEVFDIESFETKGKVGMQPLGNSSLGSEYNAAWTLEVLSEPTISAASTHLDINGEIESIPQVDITVDYETFFKQGDMLDSDSISEFFEDTSIFLALKENYLMLELLEANTTFEKNNFEIEVFLSGSASGYQQLVYTPTNSQEFIAPRRVGNDIDGVGNVEYYMNVLVDNNIPPEVLQELNIPRRAVSTNASRLRFNRDLYTAEDEEPC